MKKIHLLRKILPLTLCLCLFFSFAVTASAASGWTAENGALYFYTRSGEKLTGEQTVDNTLYQFAPDGKLTGDDLSVITEQGVYCVDGNTLVRGYKVLGDRLHYFDENGLRKENGEIDGLTVADGAVQGDGIYVRNNTARYFLANNTVVFTVSDYEAQLALSADTALTGKDTAVHLKIKNNPGLSYLQISVRYDANILTPAFVYNENLFPDFSREDTQDGMVLTWRSAADIQNDGTLATVYFTAADTMNNTLVFASCEDAKSSDATAKNIKPAAERISIGCAHQYTEYVYNEDATCTANGTKTAVCTLCKHEDTVEATNTLLPHSGGTASCLSRAICATCNSAYGEYDPSNHLHTVSRPQQQPTCTQIGWTAYTFCTDCLSEIGKSVLDPINHKNTYTIAAKAPTCTEDGHTQYTYCPDCKQITGYTEIPATGHRNTVTVPALAATCDTDGYNAYTYCNDCSRALDKVIVYALNHKNKQAVTGLRPTCTESGYSDYYHCPDCGNDFDYTVLEPLAHKNKEPVDAKKATCTEDGYSAHEHCPDCGLDFNKTVYPAQGHPSVIEIVAAAPTCTKDGYEAYFTCTVCFADIGKVVIPATGHSDLTHFKEKTATCTEDGHSAYSVCGVCDTEIGKEVYPKLNHPDIYTVGEQAPTCTEDGHNRYAFCPTCNTAFGKETYPAKNHADKILVDGLAATCSVAGHTAYFLCNDCGEKVGYQVIAPLEHKNATAYPAVKPTCTQSGMTESIQCPDCGLVLGGKELPPIEHANEYEVSPLAPTCLENGHTNYIYCPDCGREQGKETVEATGHNFTDWTVQIHATLSAQGKSIRWCVACKTQQEAATPALTLADGEIIPLGNIGLTGTIETADARSALRYAVGLDTPDELQRALADMDGNGEITPSDARLILRASVGLDTGKEQYCFVTPDRYFEKLEREEEP